MKVYRKIYIFIPITIILNTTVFKKNKTNLARDFELSDLVKFVLDMIKYEEPFCFKANALEI